MCFRPTVLRVIYLFCSRCNSLKPILGRSNSTACLNLQYSSSTKRTTRLQSWFWRLQRTGKACCRWNDSHLKQRCQTWSKWQSRAGIRPQNQVIQKATDLPPASDMLCSFTGDFLTSQPALPVMSLKKRATRKDSNNLMCTVCSGIENKSHSLQVHDVGRLSNTNIFILCVNFSAWKMWFLFKSCTCGTVRQIVGLVDNSNWFQHRSHLDWTPEYIHDLRANIIGFKQKGVDMSCLFDRFLGTTSKLCRGSRGSSPALSAEML